MLKRGAPMPFRTAIAAILFSIVGILLLAFAVGLRDVFIMMIGFALLGLVLRENDKAKRAKGGQVRTDD